MTKKLISITAGFNYDVPLEKQLPLIARAGFTHVSLGSSLKHCNFLSKEVRVKLAGRLEKYSLKLDTVHGPLTGIPGAEELKQIAIAAAELQAPVVVVHPCAWEFPESEFPSRLAELKTNCRTMAGIARETGVVFALENMMIGPASELVLKTLQEFPDKSIGFCYDSSHDQIDGPRPFDLLEALKGRLLTVHLSDRLRPFEDHVIPFEGIIKWDELCRILKTANIKFPLLFEVATTFSIPKDTEEFLTKAYQSAVRVYDKIFG